MNLTPTQRDIVEFKGGSMLVSASAGSGKTEVLARRCMALISGPVDRCDVTQLLVLTFTRAAAAELRSRIGLRLAEQAAETRDDGLRSHLRRQAALIGMADISTFDSWCGRLVRAHFAAAGVDPGFDVLSGSDAQLLRIEVLDALLDDIVLDRSPLSANVKWWLDRHSRMSDEFLREMTLQLDSYSQRLAAPRRWLESQLARHEGGDAELTERAKSVVAAGLRAECRLQAQQIATLIAAEQPEAIRTALETYQATLREWEGRLADASSLKTTADEIASCDVTSTWGARKKAPELLVRVQKAWIEKRLWNRSGVEEWKGLIEESPAASALTATLIRLTIEFRKRLDEVKRRRSAFEFADVEHHALRLLAGENVQGSMLAESVRNQYRYVLVDEYQDTSPVQVELVRIASRDARGAGEGNRFLVGDVKQSIYGFRSAEPRLFVEQTDAFSSGVEEGEVRHLSESFRAHPRLVAGVNSLFEQVMRPELGGSAYGDAERLRSRREPALNQELDADARVEIWMISPDDTDEAPSGAPDDEEVEPERIEREARIIASRMREMIRSGVKVPKGRDADGRLEPIRLSDMVVLLRAARGNAARIARVLRASGIDCSVGGRETFLESSEALDVRSVLSLMCNRRQDVPMAAFLRGPFVELTPEELLEIGSARGRRPFCEAAIVYSRNGARRQLAETLRSAFSRLDAWIDASRQLELPALLRRIIRDGDLEQFAWGQRGGRYRVSGLRALEAYAADFARGGQNGVTEFSAHLDALSRRELSTESALAGGEDAVRIMTIHAAKGLEFPVVFLAGTGSNFNLTGGRASLQRDEQGGIGVRFQEYPRGIVRVTADHHVVRHEAERREMEEEMRLLYVAATRAREKLVIIGHGDEEAWQKRLEGSRAGVRPSLIDLMDATSMMDWIQWGVASNQANQPRDGERASVDARVVKERDCRQPQVAPSTNPRSPVHKWTADDEAWVRRAERMVTAHVGDEAAHLPAAVSISGLKQRLPTEEGDAPRYMGNSRMALRLPAFAAVAVPATGNAIGAACHAFLQFADLSRLASEADVRSQLESLVKNGDIAAAQAELVSVEDMAWFGNTNEGRLAAAASRRLREVPFTFGLPVSGDAATGEFTILRGVIDCLLETADGWILYDYKTDFVREEARFEARLTEYLKQIQAYAQAASHILGSKVARAALIFTRMRRVVDAPHALWNLRELLAGGR